MSNSFSQFQGPEVKTMSWTWTSTMFGAAVHDGKGKGHQNRAPSLLEPRVFL